MAAVGDEQIRDYFRTFHRVYEDKLTAAVPESFRSKLLRYGHLQSKIVVYISTMYGIGYEYEYGSPGEIQIVKGSARVEEMVFRSPRGLIEQGGNIVARIQAPRFHMSSSEIRGRLPCRLDSPDASAILDNLRITFRGRARTIEFAELFVNRSLEFWSKEQAVERAMDEVLQAVIGIHEMQRLSIPIDEYLVRFKKRHVLVLGDFSDEGRRRIAAIKVALGRRGYYPFTLDEIEEFSEYDLKHKLIAVASVCRFVVIDDSSRAGQSAEIPVIDTLRILAIVLRLRGSESTFVNRPLEATSRVIKEAEYDEESLDQAVGETTRWAEALVKELGERFAGAYPWRTPG